MIRGKVVETEEIPAFCAVALAGLGGLPDTLLSRSIVVRMRRRAPAERVEAYRRRLYAPEGHLIRDKIESWAADVAVPIRDAWPQMPEGIEDRDADLWEPLLAIADAAGGKWPRLARVAAVALVTESRDSTPSLNIRLLSDLRGIFGDANTMFTEDILVKLCALDEAPWGDLYGGKSLNARGLSQRLHEYGVKPQSVRTGADADKTRKGYRREDLWDVWQRYLLPPEQISGTSGTSGTLDTAPPSVVPDVPDVSDDGGAAEWTR